MTMQPDVAEALAALAERERRLNETVNRRTAQLDKRAAPLEDVEDRRKAVERSERELQEQVDAVARREAAAAERELALEEHKARLLASEERLNRRAAKIAVTETQLSHRSRDVREAETRAASFGKREQSLRLRRDELDQLAAQLDERAAVVESTIAGLGEQRHVLLEREREAKQILLREQGLDEREAQLDDRDRQLTNAEAELVEWGRRIRAQDVRLQADAAEHAG